MTRESEMTGQQQPPHLSHVAPLRALVRELHKGRTVGELVKRARWRRKRPAKTPEPQNAAQFDAVAAEVDE